MKQAGAEDEYEESGIVCLTWPHLHLLHGDSEIRLVELIGDVPAQGTKLPPLLYQGMEETQTKQPLVPALGL